MERVSLYDAKTHLSALGERAANGEEIVVMKNGKPRFRLVALSVRSRPLPGTVELVMSDADRKSIAGHDWFAADEDIERLFGTRE